MILFHVDEESEPYSRCRRRLYTALATRNAISVAVVLYITCSHSSTRQSLWSDLFLEFTSSYSSPMFHRYQVASNYTVFLGHLSSSFRITWPRHFNHFRSATYIVVSSPPILLILSFRILSILHNLVLLK